MTDFSKRLRKILDEKNVKQSELSEKTGIGKSSISTYLSGDYEPKQKNIYRIATALNVPVEYLMGWEVENDTKVFNPVKQSEVTVPILGTVPAGVPIEAVEDIIGKLSITPQQAKNGTYFALRIKGNSMHPQIQDGDDILVKMQPDVESGQIAVVNINGDEATCKKVVKSADGIMLVAINQEVFEPRFYSNKEIEELPIRIVGVVVEVRRSFL